MMNLIATFPPRGLYQGIDFSHLSLLDLYQVVANIIEILLSFIAVLGVIFIIYAGIQYITSSGDPQKVATAKNTIVYAVTGIILSAAAYLVVDFLAGRFT